METIDAVLFDFGNTLFAHAPLATTIERCAAALGYTAACDWTSMAAAIDASAALPEERARGRDTDADVWASRWPVLYGAFDDQIPGLGAAVHADMHDPQAWLPFLGVGHLLATLVDRGIRVGVVSNTGWDIRAPFLARGWGALIHTWVLSYEVGAVKPDPRIFRCALDSVETPAHQVVMVGDDPHADAGAVTSGLRTLLLPQCEPGADNGVLSVLNLVGDRR